jgi:threonine aldolase
MTTSHRVIDIRSDTVTQPTNAMRKAMAEAEVGDDAYGEDPTVNKLEETAAARMGKESGLFVASGSMGNLVSALAWCERGTEAVCGVDSHLLVNEMGSIAALGGVQMRSLSNDKRGLLDADEVDASISPTAGMFPRTALLCLENTHNRGNGAALSVDELTPLADVAHNRGLAVHIDGARIFNAAVALGVPVAELAAVGDSISFCLSKGLSCPVGSVVCGDREFIDRARRMRKALGGGMRQAGIIAAAGIVALDTMVDRLADDHANAQRLAKGLAGLPGLSVNPEDIETNIVYVDVADGDGPRLAAALKERGVLANGRFNWVRFVTRNGLTAKDIDASLDVITSVVKQSANAR